MDGFPVFPAALEIRAVGDRRRTLRGSFPYSKGPGDRMATVAARGRRRKERIEGDAFGWQLREFGKLQGQLADMIQEEIDEARRQAVRQALERRNVHVLSGHSYDKPLGSMLAGNARVTSTRESVAFEVDLPDEGAMPTHMADAVRMVEAGLIGGVSPGFSIPPRARVPDAEGEEAEPGNPAVKVRVIRAAVLYELSLVTRPAYSDTTIDVRGADLWPGPTPPRRNWRVWL